MKNKKTVYFLAVLVVGMWAYIFYRIFLYSSSSATNPAFQSSFIPPVLNTNSTDSFSLSANYRDPFLGRIEIKSVNKKPKAAPVPKKVIEPLKWPAITYGGMIKSRSKSNVQLCMININGQSNFMKEGDIVTDVLLKKVFKDSIEVVFQKEKKIIRK